MATTQTEESFLQAWEAHDKCPSPVPAEDPWGSTAPQGGANSNRMAPGPPSATATDSSGPSPLNNHQRNPVFQPSSRNNSGSAITSTTNKNNNSNTRAAEEAEGSRCFDDDFGAWSETDVIFKSGLLDEEFKTVSVTAEEDDLWSSADLSSLSLSVISEDERPGELGDPADGVGTLQACDVIAPSEAGAELKGDSPVGSSPDKRYVDKPPVGGDNVGTSSRNSSFAETVPNDHGDGVSIFNEDDRHGIGINSVLDYENNRPLRDTTTHRSGTVSTAVASNAFNSGQLGYGSPATVGQGENTSINSTPGVVASNREAAALSAYAQSGMSTSASTGNSAVSESGASSNSRENTPSAAANSGTFRGGAQGIMGNTLDSDREEKETMEGEEAVTQEKSEQAPSDSSKMNGQNGEAPALDIEETVVLDADGSEVGVNGENGEKDLNVSLNTQTQTREEEFPLDDLMGGGVGDQPRENGTVEEHAEEGDQGNTEEGKMVVDEEEGSSERPEESSEVKENGQEEPAVANSEEEGPPREAEAAVSTLGSVQVVGPPSNVDHLVNVDDHHHHHHPHVMESEPTSTTSGAATSAKQGRSTTQDGPDVCTGHDTGTGHVEVLGGTHEPCTEQTRATLNDKQTITATTDIHPQQTADIADTCNNDSDTYMPNIPKGHEGLDDLDHSIDSIQSEKTFIGEKSDQVIVISEKELVTSTEAVDTDTLDEGSGEVIESLQADLEESLPSKQNDDDKQPNSEVEGSVECQSGLEPSVPKKDIEDMSLAQADIERLDSAEKALIESKVNAIFGATEEEKSREDHAGEDQTVVIDPGTDGFVVEGNISVECDSNLESASPVSVSRDVNKNLSGGAENSGGVSGEGEFVINYVDDVVNRAMEQYISSSGDPGEDSTPEPGIQVAVEAIEEVKAAEDIQGDQSRISGEVEEEAGVETGTSGNLETVVEHEESVDTSKEVKVAADTLVDESQTSGRIDVSLESVVQNEAFSEHREENVVDVVQGNKESIQEDLVIEGSQEIHMEESVQVESEPPKEEVVVPKAEPPSLLEDAPATNNLVSSGQKTQNKRWSAPVSQLPEGNFGSSESHSGRRGSDSGEPKFRPVKFRPASSSSQDAKWRRTSLGVPRGWKAPAPVDVLPPPSETVPETVPDSSPSQTEHQHEATINPPSLPVHQAVHVETHTTSEPSDISSLSSASLHSPASSDVSSEGRNVYRAEPVTVIEEVGDAALSPVSYSTDNSDTQVSESPMQGIVTVHPPVSPRTFPVTSTAPSTKRTPPLSQRVPVYEMKEPPTSPTTGGAYTKREAFGQGRSMTTGDLPKKLSKAEEERQQVLAAVRVKRPVKAKWQGQIELEEKEKESKIVNNEDMMSISSAQKYEERKKQQLKSKSFDGGSSLQMSVARPVQSTELEEGRETRYHSGGETRGSRPHSLIIDASPEGSIKSELEIPRDEALSPNGDTCSSGYTSGRSTPAGEDASRNLTLPKASGPGVSMYKEYQSLLKEGDSSDQSNPTNEETGLKPLPSREPGESYVKSAVKRREKKGGSKVNSHVVKQNRISFVEQEVLRSKQQEEEFRREREQREQELRQHKPPVPAPAARLQSPTSSEPPAVKPAPAKPMHRPANSKAKAIYQELNYNPKTGGGNRSTSMVKDWESKFDG